MMECNPSRGLVLDLSSIKPFSETMILPSDILIKSWQSNPIIEYCDHLLPPSTDSSRKLFFR